MAKKENKKKEKEIFVNETESGLASFTKRKLPTDEEIKEFEQVIDSEIDEGKDDEVDEIIEESEEDDELEYFVDTLDEEKDDDIEESLNEIYHDEKGNAVDVKSFELKKKRGFIYWFLTIIFTVGIIIPLAIFVYNYFYIQKTADPNAIEFIVDGNKSVVAGEEFFYTIKYENLSNVALNDVEIELNFPDNFVMLDTFPEPDIDKTNKWSIDTIPSEEHGNIKIKGMIVGPEDSKNILIARMLYVPENFSSKFKKETSFNTDVISIGYDFKFDYSESALVNEESEVRIDINPRDENYINTFRISIDPQENLEFIGAKSAADDTSSSTMVVEEIRPGVYKVSNAIDKNDAVILKLKFTQKEEQRQNLNIKFSKINESDNSYINFYEDVIGFEVMKSDLNLVLIANGSKNNQGIDFGQTLNYSINYSNKGETSMKDVVIMTVIDSEFVDWDSLADENDGIRKRNTITWTKNEITDLEEIGQGEEGVIDFSIDVSELNDEVDIDKSYSIKTYSQFSVGSFGDDEEGNKEEDVLDESDNRSNTILITINSDLKFLESVRYFNEDNIPVGTGPHPPKVGEETSYKVYWEIDNTLHELKDLVVTTKLPDYVDWDGKNDSGVGTVRYKESTHEVVWDVGRLPVTVLKAKAEFSIRINPTEDDENKIMVLLAGSKVTASDSETGDELDKTSKVKTSKLEDDEVASGDGIIIK